MNRDLVVHQVVAIDAQIRHMIALTQTVGSAEELKARLPALLEESAAATQRIPSRYRRPNAPKAASIAAGTEGATPR
jgi:hypothetical protein